MRYDGAKSLIYMEEGFYFPDVDLYEQPYYKRRVSKARIMTFCSRHGMWTMGVKSKSVYVPAELGLFPEEVVELNDYLSDPLKITKAELDMIKMMYPQHKWDTAFLKRDRIGW